MPKRSLEETKEERWCRKMKKYEHKLQETRRKNSHRIIYSSEEDDVHPQEHLECDPAITTDPECIDESINSAVPNNDDPAVECIDEPINSTVPNNDDPAVETTTDTDNFDPELLEVLGDKEIEVIEYGEDLQEDISKRFQQILLHGLKKETKDELTKKYPFPKNVPLAKAPTLNPEIGAMLVDTCKLRDKRLVGKQDQLGRALSALGKAMTILLKKKPDIHDALRILNEAGKLLADSHYAETDTRRSVIIPLVDKSLTESFKDRKRDGFLFGENLGDLVKNSRGIKKTSQMIQATASTSSNLNSKGPPSRVHVQRGNQAYQYRAGAGGQRGAYTSRRRAAPPPPPPPPSTRRYPPPPPPPPAAYAARRAPAQAQRPYPSSRPRN